MVDDEKYKIALAEIDDILKFADDEILLKIPESFKKFVKENKDKNYISNINPYLPLSYQNLKKETISILALINQDFLTNKNIK